MSKRVKLPYDIYRHIAEGLAALKKEEHANTQYGIVSSAKAVLRVQETLDWFVRNFEGDGHVTDIDTLRELHGNSELQETGQRAEGLQES